ncbi:MAG: FAD-dependent thymidylate synthase [Metallosphaera sp.]|uniref:FAD-dependent thymidylate synthase n=1 Tax=Metallosphaera sp. TaxID=2020860 RepID=UPI00315E1E32
MLVKLVSYTTDGEKVVAIAAKMSRSRKGWDDHVDMSEDEVRTWVSDAILHGYWSVLEHSSYTFSIEGISRVASHQLVRHRVASYTQTSHRFARPTEEYYNPIIPNSIKKRGLDEVAKKTYNDAYNRYFELLKSGVPEEDARYVLPNGVNTNLVVTMNARELYNFFGLRLCSRAQWEIRAIAWQMLEEVKRVHPTLFRYAGPNCIIHENFIRNEGITLDDVLKNKNTRFISERCIEGVNGDGILKCIVNSRNGKG